MTKINYEQLLELSHEYTKEGLIIALFPCNQFNHQEPGTNAEIQEFVSKIGGDFKLHEKINVNGKNACELYKYLRAKSKLKGREIGWNFTKFLVNRAGTEIKFFAPHIKPKEMSSDICSYI